MLRWVKRLILGINEREREEEEMEETILTSKAELETLQRSIEQHCQLINSVDRALKCIKLKRQTMQEEVETMLMETYDVNTNNDNNAISSENVYCNVEKNGVDELPKEQKIELLRHHIQQEYKLISKCCDEEIASTEARLFELRIALETLNVHKRQLESVIAKGEEQYCTTMCQFHGANFTLIPSLQMEIAYDTESRSSVL